MEGATKPLIELAERASARIRAREAQAEEQLDIVRQAFDRDSDYIERTFGGYLDLHQEKLRDAASQEQEGLAYASLICAQLVFGAHANEYRLVLQSLADLAPVLQELQEATITKYGSHTRATIERMVAEQLLVASEYEQPIEVECESGVQVLTGDAQFWRERRKDFERYNSGENRSLAAYWHSLDDCWTLRGTPEAELVFTPLASIAAKGFQNYDIHDPSKSWLDELRYRPLKRRDMPTKRVVSERAIGGRPKVAFEPPSTHDVLWGAQLHFENDPTTIKDLFAASAILCLELEATADSRGMAQPEDAGNATKRDMAPATTNTGDDQQRIPTHPILVEGSSQCAAKPTLKATTHASAGTPEERLSSFILVHPGSTYADIKFSARVHTPDFQDWRNGRLKASSIMSQRIEDVLSGTAPLKKKPHKNRPN